MVGVRNPSVNVEPETINKSSKVGVTSGLGGGNNRIYGHSHHPFCVWFLVRAFLGGLPIVF